jgi:hypothetical protein
VVEVVLFKAGAQLPVIPLLEVVGKGDKLPPKQIGATGVKVGVGLEVTLIHICSVYVHPKLSVTW